MIKAVITRCPNKRMTGFELRRLRIAADLSERGLAAGIGTYRRRVQRWERLGWEYFELVPNEMEALLTALGASSL